MSTSKNAAKSWNYLIWKSNGGRNDREVFPGAVAGIHILDVPDMACLRKHERSKSAGNCSNDVYDGTVPIFYYRDGAFPDWE